MLLLNIDYVPGKEVEPLGLVKGTVVQTKNLANDNIARNNTQQPAQNTHNTHNHCPPTSSCRAATPG